MTKFGINDQNQYSLRKLRRPEQNYKLPVLFLLMIADFAVGVSPATRVSSFVDDTRVKRKIKDAEVDCPALQDDLQTIFQWVELVGLQFNSKNFECVRYWPGMEPPKQIYLSPSGSLIEEKSHLRDLGVEMRQTGT